MKNSKSKEISFFDFLKILYLGRLKIIIFVLIGFIIGIGLSLATKNKYSFKMLIEAKDNLGLKEHRSFTLQKFNFYTEKEIFKIFMNRFKNKEEVKIAIKNNEYVKKKLLKLNKKKQTELINQIADEFRIADRNDTVFHIVFKFDNINASKEILSNSIKLINQNSKKIFFKKIIKDLALIEDLYTINNDELKIMVELEKKKILAKVNILKQHLKISRELNIKEPLETQINNNNLDSNYYLLDSNYYLIGYQHIEKKIKLLENLSDKEILSSSTIFKKKIEDLAFQKINQNILNYQLEKISKTSRLDEIINYNINDLQISYPRSMYKNIIVFSLLGLIFGVFFLLFDKIRKEIK